MLNSDRHGSGAGAIVLTGFNINSNGGNIVLGGGANPGLDKNIAIAINNAAFGASGNKNGVRIVQSTLNANTGDITIRGKGLVGTDYSDGISLERVNILTSGNVLLSGAGGGFKIFSDGIDIDGATINVSGAGNLDLIGIGANVGGNNPLNHGVIVSEYNSGTQSTLKTLNGTLSINGQTRVSGTEADRFYGVYLTNSTSLESAGLGNIIINGTAQSGGDQAHHGIISTGSISIRATGSGNISLFGQAGDDAIGINLSGATIATNTGSILLNGTSGVSGSTIDNYGIALLDGTSLQSTGSNSIRLIANSLTGSPDLYIQNGSNIMGGSSFLGDILIDANTIDINDVALSTNRQRLLSPPAPLAPTSTSALPPAGWT